MNPIEESNQQDEIKEENAYKKYETHFTGLEAYGSSGFTKLENLIDAALKARNDASRQCRIRYGAALISSTGRMFSACNLDSNHQKQLSICAERLALLQARSNETDCVIEVLY